MAVEACQRLFLPDLDCPARNCTHLAPAYSSLLVCPNKAYLDLKRTRRSPEGCQHRFNKSCCCGIRNVRHPRNDQFPTGLDIEFWLRRLASAMMVRQSLLSYHSSKKVAEIPLVDSEPLENSLFVGPSRRHRHYREGVGRR